ncbi:hypothetical protein HN51_022009 [Arachis hypogaea]|uniref:Uncharacterized protein n=2 Tax=Arachis TaxID=3817 RepID=A0A445EDV4_ARAHY|nr:uncharacterized protein LOC107474150 [Arachis duranensis]XP_029145852.1 uncharacterized protein LOC112723505 [Arachis hypogaea]QHO53124.1 putative leucine-rich repeat-containing protein [Arachis hypogaea]RYR73617.1 hypothetical protein Ahy_A02g008043 [Arachis hypogaea]
MAWVRSAVNKAVEAGGQSSIRRSLRNYADSMKLHATTAVVGGARVFHDRMVAQNMRSFRHTVKRLEEVSVSCRGVERVQLLRRWLVALKEIERLVAAFAGSNPNDLLPDEIKELPISPTLVYYVDPDIVDEPKNFRDVFLQSQALEGITLSMILEAPNEEEVSLLSEIYGLCIKGEKEERTALLASVQDLAKAFAGYEDEVLAKREELLQYVQAAISGLKVNADLMRIEDEVFSLKEKIEKFKPSNFDAKSNETTTIDVKANHEALAQIQMYSKLEELLLKKKYFTCGDSSELHAEKIDKLKILSESLANSATKAQNRISENRSQKEEALNFRLTKTKEVDQIEKEVTMEIEELEKLKDELEEKLKKVNSLLLSARMRLHNAREERDQFNEASNEIVVHLKAKEDEMIRSIASYTRESNVVDTWMHFLENTWLHQTSHTKKEKEQINVELQRYGENYVNLIIQLLSSYEEKLGSSVKQMRKLVENLSSNKGLENPTAPDNEDSKVNPRKKLQDEFLDIESKFLATLTIVETINNQFHIQREGIYRKDSDNVIKLLNAIKKIKEEYESIKRPKLEIEITPRKQEQPQTETPKTPKTPRTPSQKKTFMRSLSSISLTNRMRQDEAIMSPSIHRRSKSAGIDSLQMEVELDDMSDYDSAEEISEWEFDDVEQDHHTRS